MFLSRKTYLTNDYICMNLLAGFQSLSFSVISTKLKPLKGAFSLSYMCYVYIPPPDWRHVCKILNSREFTFLKYGGWFGPSRIVAPLCAGQKHDNTTKSPFCLTFAPRGAMFKHDNATVNILSYYRVFAWRSAERKIRQRHKFFVSSPSARRNLFDFCVLARQFAEQKYGMAP
jgi:hypothetical protein